MKTLQEKIAIMQAAADGKEIEIWDGAMWITNGDPGWNWASCDYRVKRVPRRMYALQTPRGLDRTMYFDPPVFDEKDVAAGYSVVEFVEVLK